MADGKKARKTAIWRHQPPSRQDSKGVFYEDPCLWTVGGIGAAPANLCRSDAGRRQGTLVSPPSRGCSGLCSGSGISRRSELCDGSVDVSLLRGGSVVWSGPVVRSASVRGSRRRIHTICRSIKWPPSTNWVEWNATRPLIPSHDLDWGTCRGVADLTQVSIPRWVLKVGATARSQPYRPPMSRSVEDGPRSADDVEFCGVIGDNALES